MNYEKKWSKYWYNNILDVNNENVNFNTLSLNRNISLEVILENIDKPWDFDVVNNFLNGIVNTGQAAQSSQEEQRIPKDRRSTIPAKYRCDSGALHV